VDWFRGKEGKEGSAGLESGMRAREKARNGEKNGEREHINKGG